jgi:hypothetical protein
MSRSFYEIVIPVVEGRSVLDVGSIGHSYTGRDGYKTWNFGMLKQHARRVKGFELPELQDQVMAARADGHDIEIGNAETYVATEPYDVVFAGDLIEHLSNPGLFLERAHRNLVSDGILVLATPNTYSLAKMIRVIGRITNEPPVNPEHTFYFTPKTLGQLLRRYGFQIDRVEYCDFEYTASHGNGMKRAKLRLNSWLSSRVPQFSQVMVAICSKVLIPFEFQKAG